MRSRSTLRSRLGAPLGGSLHPRRRRGGFWPCSASAAMAALRCARLRQAGRRLRLPEPSCACRARGRAAEEDDASERAFAYRDGELCAEAVPLDEIARAVGTPAYVYAGGRHAAPAAAVLRRPSRASRSRLCYALKANSNLAVIRTLAEAGAGAEIVSGGELQRALAAGVPPERIVFSGVGKSRDEMAMALDAGIAQFNVELVPELVVLGEVAAARRLARAGRAADQPRRRRRQPRQDQHRPPPRQVRHRPTIRRSRSTSSRSRLAGIEVVGLHLHIGSQILSLAPFEAAFRRAHRAGRRQLRARRASASAGSISAAASACAIAAEPELDLAGYARAGARAHGRASTSSWCSSRAAGWSPRPGVLLSRVLYVKQGAERPCVVLDAGMNNLLRPALYDAYHAILPVPARVRRRRCNRWTWSGPICESDRRVRARRAICRRLRPKIW